MSAVDEDIARALPEGFTPTAPLELPRGRDGKRMAYGSYEAACCLATVKAPAYPVNYPTVLMWADVGKRTATCGACAKAIKCGSPRIVLHVRLGRPQEMLKGGKTIHIKDRRTYFHVNCMSDGLACGILNRDRRDCFDCGEPPPDGATHHPLRVDAGAPYHFADLCLKCGDKKWWFECAECGAYFRHRNVVEVVQGVFKLRAPGDPDPELPPKPQRFYSCKPCHQRYRNWITREEYEAVLEAQREEKRKFREYAEAVARGERPENPFPKMDMDEWDDDFDSVRPF